MTEVAMLQSLDRGLLIILILQMTTAVALIPCLVCIVDVLREIRDKLK